METNHLMHNSEQIKYTYNIKANIDESFIKDYSFVITLIIKGSGKRQLDATTMDISDEQLHFSMAGQEEKWDSDSNMEFTQIFIPKSLFTTFRSYLKYPISHYMKIGSIQLGEDSFKRFLREFTEIKEESEKYQFSNIIIETRIKIILLMISKEVYKIHYEKRMDSACLLSRFITLVFENFRKERTVKFYADKLAVTTNYLNVLCNKHLQKTATSIIYDEMLAEIKQYLITANMSLKEVATLMSFSSTNSFHAFFKRNTGMTPKEFQQQQQQFESAHRSYDGYTFLFN